MVSQRVRMMVTVKAAPEPSRSYIDTVCVAGVRVDGDVREWVRLYPVPFRHLSTAQQFAKYDIIEVDTLPAKNDSRSESRRPIWESLDVVAHVGAKAARDLVLSELPAVTMCDLLDGVRAHMDAQSLGIVTVRELRGFMVSKHPGWSSAQQQAIQDAIHQPALFGEPPQPVAPLEAPRFVVKIRYLCAALSCRGHQPTLLDFELAALQHRGRFSSDEALRTLILKKFRDEQFHEGLRTSLYVGNIADPPKRKSFSALGIHHVPRGSDWGSTLF
ncbi:hypothetical protein [Curtobacterium sp. ISL-83]|uniref:hypothetical protein n=1 Tax=Curtobacterium sp. ISL-83 TaxID=2819145 RepID=UPI001BE65F24|nr:hypothetical protein [Curtobacterium sp. ISL-83]MBT2502508.1 hypothetical protein [Curtobacterium sp. ISL-83]